MAQGKASAERDPHRRFTEWLDTNTEDDPPRDLAVHATVCARCQQRIAALDLLTAIDPAAAGIPPVRPVTTRAWLRTTGRAAVMVGGLAALLAVGIGSWRLIQASALLGPALESPTQAVLGGTGLPEPTPTTSQQGTEPPSTVGATPSEPDATQPQPDVTPPPVIVQPTPAPVVPTAQPTLRQTATARPTRSPAPTQVPVPTPTPQPATPPPTPPLTPAPTPTPGP